MSDGGFCDFPQQLDASMISSLSGYSQRHGSQENFDHHPHSKAGPGYYSEYGAGQMSSSMAIGSESISETAHDMSGLNALAATAMSCATGSVYDQIVNYPMKPEKNLPPTPPGSPDDPKEDIQSLQRRHLEHAMAHNYLTEHMRLSDRKLSYSPLPARSPSVTSPPMMASPSLMSPGLESMDGMSPYPEGASSPALARALGAIQSTQKRPRSEKKPIPEDAKDGKYYERRKRNNNAAKKSRDARKAREDEIAIRASFLEKENAILRAQVATLREEANSLRQLLLQKRARH